MNIIKYAQHSLARKIIVLHTCKQYYPIFIFRPCESDCIKVFLQQNRKLDVYMGNTKSKHSKPPPLDAQLPLILERVFQGKGVF